MLKEGPVFSLITPFKNNGDIDFNSLRKYIDLLIDVGAEQIYSMAFNGKYETLSSEEIITLNTFIISSQSIDKTKVDAGFITSLTVSLKGLSSFFAAIFLSYIGKYSAHNIIYIYTLIAIVSFIFTISRKDILESIN